MYKIDKICEGFDVAERLYFLCILKMFEKTDFPLTHTREENIDCITHAWL